jgi:hypothetical protein
MVKLFANLEALAHSRTGVILEFSPLIKKAVMPDKPEFRKSSFCGVANRGLLLPSIFMHAMGVVHSNLLRKVHPPIQ